MGHGRCERSVEEQHSGCGSMRLRAHATAYRAGRGRGEHGRRAYGAVVKGVRPCGGRIDDGVQGEQEAGGLTSVEEKRGGEA